MSELEIVKFIIQAGFAGLAAGLVIVLFQLVRNNQTSEQGLMRIVEKLLTTMTDKFAEMNTQTQQHHEAMIGRIMARQDDAFRAQIETIGGHMAPVTARRDAQIDQLPQRVRDEMTPALDHLPQAIQEALEPKSKALQLDIEALIASLEDKLSTRIDSATDEIPNRTNVLVREELATLRGVIEQSLSDLLETAHKTALQDHDESKESGNPAQEID